MDLLDQDFIQPRKLLEVRWIASKEAAIRAIIRDYNGLVLDIGEAVTLTAEGGPLKARLANLYNFITLTQYLLTLHFLQDLLAELSKLSARFQREDYRVFALHDTLEEFVRVLNSCGHNESPSITALKDRIKFQHGLVFFQERLETIGTPVNDYNGKSFTAFRKESVDLLQNVLIFFNLRFPETETTRHFRVFQLK
ncbi:hypothetical protein RvY_06434 [Ramazzottius varieornatus]|uniref:Uncharacterized protein n=1 Tax=Ramazzottius varieornatus TaxID=947166 RepID=A0A1D1UYK6_RAMVA|nr:hypothetical protein RvY_06434 [Ramazzottius varieornatus]